MDGSCWDRFGRKTLLTFTGYKERAPGVLREIERVGMKGVNVQWQFPNPFEDVLLAHLKCIRCVRSEKGAMNLAMAHYAAVKTAYCLGVDHVLIMEDDIRFIRDVGAVEELVRLLPDDFDIGMFDYTILGPIRGSDAQAEYVTRMRRERRINEGWCGFDVMRSTGCYALSRRAMKRYIWLNEAAVTDPSIGKLRASDHWFNRRYMGPDMKMMFAYRPAAIQRRYPGGGIHPDLDLESYYRDVVGAKTEEYER